MQKHLLCALKTDEITLKFMKQALWILFILFLSSCRPCSTQLAIAERIVEDNPDSVLAILDAIPPYEELSECDRAHYGLLYVQAKDKCNRDIANDSIIEFSAEYFSAVRDSLRAGKAYLYAGHVAKASNNPSLAMAHYVRAKELMPDNGEPKYQFMIRNYLGDAYYAYFMYHKGVSEYKEAYQYADLLDNDTYRCISVSQTGFGLTASPDLSDSVIYYEMKALELAKKAYPQKQSFIFSLLSKAHLNKGEHDLALHYCNLAIAEFNVEDNLNYYIRKGLIFMEMNQNDSAMYCFNKALVCGQASIKALSHQLLSEVYKKQGNYSLSLAHLEHFNSYKDTVAQAQEAEYVRNTNLLVRHIQVKDDNYRLYRQQGNTENWIFYSSFAIALLFLSGGFAYYWTTANKTRKILIQEKEIAEQKAQIREQELAQARLEKDISEHEKAESALRENFFRQLNFMACPALLDNELSENENDDSGLVSPEEWKKIVANTNAVYDDFVVRLQKKYCTLNDDDLHYCCLIKMGLSHSELSKVFNRKKDSVKKRLKYIRMEKMKLPGGDDFPFGDFLKDF